MVITGKPGAPDIYEHYSDDEGNLVFCARNYFDGFSKISSYEIQIVGNTQYSQTFVLQKSLDPCLTFPNEAKQLSSSICGPQTIQIKSINEAGPSEPSQLVILSNTGICSAIQYCK